MNTKLTKVNDILKLGIQREIESQRLYGELEAKMTLAASRYAFSVLQKEEHRHQTILENYLSGGFKVGSLDLNEVIDYHIAEYLDQPRIAPGMGLPAVFLLAANKEKMAHEFYSALANAHPEGEIKRLFFKLATEELGHKQKVEAMYSDVAFPQTDGG